MKITFLGTNGWFDTNTGSTTCTLLETEEAYIILDAGGGLYKTYDLIKEDKPIYMLLTHLHMDHIQGLPVLPLFQWHQGLTIIIPDNMKQALLNFMQPPYMPTPQNLKMEVNISGISEAKELPFKLTTLPLEHTVPTTGYRIEAEDKAITYALDTGICENLKKLAQNADLLITECSYLPGQMPNNAHLNPQEAAKIAKEAGAEILTLIHFKADDYNTMEKRDEALAAAGAIFAHTFAPYDGDQLTV